MKETLKIIQWIYDNSYPLQLPHRCCQLLVDMSIERFCYTYLKLLKLFLLALRGNLALITDRRLLTGQKYLVYAFQA